VGRAQKEGLWADLQEVCGVLFYKGKKHPGACVRWGGKAVGRPFGMKADKQQQVDSVVILSCPNCLNEYQACYGLQAYRLDVSEMPFSSDIV
jgi:hypothetical protein